MMDGADDVYLMEHPDNTEDIPVLDIAPYIAGEPGARERLSKELGRISETVGFFQLIGHGLPQSLIDRMFGEARRLHLSPLEKRRTIKNIGRGTYRGIEDRPNISLNQKPRLNSSFNVHREYPPDHPMNDMSTVFRYPNAWPDWLPGFKENVLEYYDRGEALGRLLLPLWAAALDMPVDYFDKYFVDPHITTTLLHYPPQKVMGNRQYGIPPHTDNNFITILAQEDVPGLAVEMPSGHWRIVEPRRGAFVINSGNTMVRISNGRFKSTRHRVINIGEHDRFSVPIFFAPDLEAIVECAPTCVTAENPARYPPIRYEDLFYWHQYSEGARGFEQKAVGPDVKSEGLWVPAQDAK